MISENVDSVLLKTQLDSEQQNWLLNLSPAKMAALMSVAIFLTEFLVMLLLDRLPPLTPSVGAIVDSVFLIVFLVPVYIALYRPFWKVHQKSESDIRQLNYRLTGSAEEERRKIALDLHDHCDQTLVTLQKTVEAIQLRLLDSDEESSALCQEVDELLGRLNSDIRTVSSALHPPQLEDQGISAALRQYILNLQMQNVGVSIEFLEKGEVRPIEKQTAIQIYRIAQETLKNALQHSGSTLIRVHLEYSPNAVAISIVDNGCGFDPKKCSTGGVGLVGIRERATSFGGSLTVHSEPGRGTVLRVSFK